MNTFEYELVIENDDGPETRTARRIGFARPIVGEEEQRRIYTWPRVYVRKVPADVK